MHPTDLVLAAQNIVVAYRKRFKAANVLVHSD